MTSIEAIINRQLLKWELDRKSSEPEAPDRPRPLPIVSISRQTGSRGSYFGSRLAQRLGYQRLHREAIATSSVAGWSCWPSRLCPARQLIWPIMPSICTR